MKNTISKGWLSLLIVMGILILDQIIKIAVKTNMYYNESIRITDWFYIHFVENPGMAFGMQVIPKAVQTIGRILFAGIIIWYIGRLIKANCKRGYLICISLILAGAIGNIIGSNIFNIGIVIGLPCALIGNINVGTFIGRMYPEYNQPEKPSEGQQYRLRAQTYAYYVHVDGTWEP
jgi:signal peptidase II